MAGHNFAPCQYSPLLYRAADTTAGQILANLPAQMHYNATVATYGLTGGFILPTTVMPFILRNVRLQGVDSVSVPAEN